MRQAATARPVSGPHAAATATRGAGGGRALRVGALGGITAIFVAAIGMVEAFVTRPIVSGLLDLGHLTLFLVPFVAGYIAGRPPPPLQGRAAEPAGPSNVGAGLVAGVTTGVLLALFALFAANVEVRPLLHVNERLAELLTLSLGLGTGSVVLVALSGLVGTVGAAMHLLGARWRRPVLAALVWVFTFGLLQDLITQVFRGVRLESLATVFYAPAGGLTLLGMALVAGLSLTAYMIAEPRRVTVRSRMAAMPRRRRQALLLAAIACAVVLLALTPIVLGNFLSEILDLVGIYLLMALGLNIVIGYAGLLDLGYVAFFAVGAYTTALLTSPASPRWSPELTFWAALPFVMLAAALAGVIVGTPVLRMRGDYLAIVTLGFGEIARILFVSNWLAPTFGGAQGITRIPPVSVGPVTLNTPPEFFYPIAAFVLLAAYVSWALQDSRIGRAWMAMREDEPVAEAMGINIVTAKLSAFVVGAVLASFGGALFASKIGAIFPSSFQILVSIIVLVIIIVGGLGSMPGVAVGALVLVGLPELLREFEEYRLLIYGMLLIFMMLHRPEGLLPNQRRVAELRAEDLSQDSWFSQEREQQRRDAPASDPSRDPDAGLIT
jgi:branched-chain amino acid transport system permease protein